MRRFLSTCILFRGIALLIGIMGTSRGFYCKACREQLVIDINREASTLRWVEIEVLEATVECTAIIRQPATHSLVVEWLLDTEEEGQGRVGNPYTLQKAPLTPGTHTIRWVVRDPAAVLDPEQPGNPPKLWVLPGYQYLEPTSFLTYASIMKDETIPEDAFEFEVP